MNTVLHRAETRGSANFGWLKANYTFSFANYYNPSRIHFGVLRVLNDDSIDANMGFPSHPHDNMEIITLPIKGAIAHKDSMGNITTIQQGDIQVMSAGSGIEHSEYNPSTTLTAEGLQIWIFPNKKNVTPRYQKWNYSSHLEPNKLLPILSPDELQTGVWIHQQAWFHIGKFEENSSEKYEIKQANNGVYAFVIEGSFIVNNIEINQRDGLGIWNTDNLDIISTSADAKILLIEVPMTN